MSGVLVAAAYNGLDFLIQATFFAGRPDYF
jgi:hypothetical protein